MTESDARQWALELAAQYQRPDDSTDSIVERAERYAAFLTKTTDG